MYQVCYWDAAANAMRLRAATQDEEAEIDARKATAPRVVPESVPMLNAHLVLIASGWMPGVREYLAAMEGVEGEQARAFFEMAQTCHRYHPLVQAIPAALGKTESEVDALFIAASRLSL